MKKYITGILAILCLVFAVGIVPVNAALHFSKSEAYEILCNGTWSDTVTGKSVRFNQNTTSLYENGYTNPSGDSLLYFGSKGADFKMYVTYYPDQGKYYARILCNMHGNGYEPFADCAVKE